VAGRGVGHVRSRVLACAAEVVHSSGKCERGQSEFVTAAPCRHNSFLSLSLMKSRGSTGWLFSIDWPLRQAAVRRPIAAARDGLEWLHDDPLDWR